MLSLNWNRRSLLLLPLLVAWALPAQDRFSSVERVVAVGDVHGDWDAFTSVLRSAKVIDKRNRWAGGNTHLIQIGDIPDRGPATRRIYDLLMDLDKQARRAGGRVHALIGNHDAMMIYGDLRYVTPEEFASFRSANAQELRSRWFELQLPELRKSAQSSGRNATDDELRTEFEKSTPLGWVEHRQAFGPDGKYGKWVRQRPVAVIVNDILYVHAGISPKYAHQPVEELTKVVQAELTDLARLEKGVTTDDQGPLWYRGLAREAESALEKHVADLLAFHDVRAVAVGHTPTAGAILPRFGGRVLLIDVGMSKAYGGPPAALVIESGKRFALHRGTLLPLPGRPEDLRVYLERAAALDPPPSPLEKLLSGSGVEATKDIP